MSYDRTNMKNVLLCILKILHKVASTTQLQLDIKLGSRLTLDSVQLVVHNMYTY